jgi:iron-sulfur cluster repair protein YtfE (RIC family)
MRRGFAFFAVLLLGASWASAQPPPGQPQPPRKPQPEPTLQGEQKLRWVCKQLRVDEAQMQKADALLQAYKAEVDEQRQDPAGLLQRIQDKYAELRAAEAEGNAELAKKLRAELKEMTPGAQAESRFFTDLEQVLTEEQKAKLPATRKRAESTGDVAMKPIHVLKAARKAGLTAQQQKEAEKLLETFRAEIVASRPENAQAAAERVDKLVEQVRGILTPDQRPAFDKEIEALRDNPPPATALQMPGAPPTPPPTGTPELPAPAGK